MSHPVMLWRASHLPCYGVEGFGVHPIVSNYDIIGILSSVHLYACNDQSRLCVKYNSYLLTVHTSKRVLPKAVMFSSELSAPLK